ncbi:hypothetical protein [Actinopolymorpha cephalotaxi]|uniref:Secreted protein n=1 Tax=Actinopolymorpha cephalotaxi TaxID=504797 RepID=A0ABX2RW74_9ACTN|nr:hypothetical protein [Actinopolymorpha cephalotaxi]NYH81236.1 hypothetical protein [Actinopolymorpha cephalotaxi]
MALGFSTPAANAQTLDTDDGVPVAVETPVAAHPQFSYDCDLEADPPEFTVRGTRITGYVRSGCDYPLPAGQITDAYIEHHVGNAEWKTLPGAHGQSKKIARAVLVDANFPCSADDPVRRTVRTVGTLRAWKFGHLPESKRVVSGVVTLTC